MPRPKRRKDAELLRHVVSRGVGRQSVFLDEGDYQKFSFLLTEMVDRFDVQCWDFALMSNHFHLALFNEQENLSEAMQFLKGEYAIWWNRVHRRVGHVFEGPFKDQIVEEESYARSLVRYIALNPVRAGLGQRAEDWPWSACRYLAGLADPPDFLAWQPVLRQFGDIEVDLEGARKAYVRHVSTQTPMELMREEAFRSRQRVVGSRDFKRFMNPRRSAQPSSGSQSSHVFTPGFV